MKKVVIKPKKKSEPITMGLSRELGKVFKMSTKPHSKRREIIQANLRQLGFKGSVFYKYSKMFYLTKVAMEYIQKKARAEGFVGKVFRKNKLTVAESGRNLSNAPALSRKPGAIQRAL